MAENTDKLNVLKARLIELKQEKVGRPIDNDQLDKMIDIAVDCYKNYTNTSHSKGAKKK